MIHRKISKALLTSVLFLVSLPAFSSTPAEKQSGDKEESFDITRWITHHVQDAHDFHILDWKGYPISLPLPVILYTDNGFVFFMTSKFHHDDEGKIVVEAGGHRFVKFHEKIYFADENPGQNGAYVTFDQAGYPVNTKPINLSITKNVFGMFLSMIFLCFVFIVSARSYGRKNSSGVPKGIARFTEPLILFVRDEIAIPNLGEKKYKRYFPYLLTIFFFIWVNNIFGLIPFFPFSANLSGNIAFTMTLATFTFVITTYNGNKNYWKHILWVPGVPVLMKIFLMPIEIIGMFIKPISLMIRLFANITAGHIIVLSLTGLIFVIGTIWVAPVSVLFVLFISIIEILVTAIQAYIFTMLSALYIGMATEEEH